MIKKIFLLLPLFLVSCVKDTELIQIDFDSNYTIEKENGELLANECALVFVKNNLSNKKNFTKDKSGSSIVAFNLIQGSAATNVVDVNGNKDEQFIEFLKTTNNPLLYGESKLFNILIPSYFSSNKDSNSFRIVLSDLKVSYKEKHYTDGKYWLKYVNIPEINKNTIYPCGSAYVVSINHTNPDGVMTEGDVPGMKASIDSHKFTSAASFEKASQFIKDPMKYAPICSTKLKLKEELGVTVTSSDLKSCFEELNIDQADRVGLETVLLKNIN